MPGPAVVRQRQTTVPFHFSGLDNALSYTATCSRKNMLGKDGVPIVFSHEIDSATLATECVPTLGATDKRQVTGHRNGRVKAKACCFVTAAA